MPIGVTVNVLEKLPLDNELMTTFVVQIQTFEARFKFIVPSRHENCVISTSLDFEVFSYTTEKQDTI